MAWLGRRVRLDASEFGRKLDDAAINGRCVPV